MLYIKKQELSATNPELPCSLLSGEGSMEVMPVNLDQIQELSAIKINLPTNLVK